MIMNAKTIDFTIRPGIKFPNGQAVTADDIMYSFELQLEPAAAGQRVGARPGAVDRRHRGAPKNKVRMHLKSPDARVFGYLAWQRYSSIVPKDMYTTLNAATQGIGTGPYMLDGSYVPNDHLNYVRNPNYWKKGLPYLDAINYKIITDEQARIAALRAGAIDGATSRSTAPTRSAAQRSRCCSGLTAAFRELQFTIKAGENKPWADKRVRQAVNFAINRHGDHPEGLQRRRAVQRPRRGRLRPVGRSRRRS